MKTWLVGGNGLPLAEVPWGNRVQEQVLAEGVQVRSAHTVVEKLAFKHLQPERQLE